MEDCALATRIPRCIFLQDLFQLTQELAQRFTSALGPLLRRVETHETRLRKVGSPCKDVQSFNAVYKVKEKVAQGTARSNYVVLKGFDGRAYEMWNQSAMDLYEGEQASFAQESCMRGLGELIVDVAVLLCD